MKFLILFCCISAQLLIVTAKVIPKYLPQPCPKSHPEYSECTTKVLHKLGPYVLKGVREINFPKMHPLDIPLFAVNRTVNDFVSLNAVLKNMQTWGFNTTEIKSFKFDPVNKVGEIHLNIPYMYVKMEYKVTGRLLTIDLNSEGSSKGNSTNTELFVKFSLKEKERLGVKYYTFDDFHLKSTIEYGHVNLTAKYPENQLAADLINNFFNEDPKRSIDAIRPVYEECAEVFYKSLAEQILNTIPAEELIPE